MPINKNTFCVAPWFSIHLSSQKKLAPCCLIKKTNEYDYNQLEEYFNSPGLNELRSDLLNGVKNKNCASCWHAEEQGGDSLRLISNRTVGKSTDTQLMPQIENPEVSNIKSFDLTLGNLCNLKCVMCTPILSSQLLAEAILILLSRPVMTGSMIRKILIGPKERILSIGVFNTCHKPYILRLPVGNLSSYHG